LGYAIPWDIRLKSCIHVSDTSRKR
jgi:hypothetical protein